jgi:hypothetical protein
MKLCAYWSAMLRAAIRCSAAMSASTSAGVL